MAAKDWKPARKPAAGLIARAGCWERRALKDLRHQSAERVGDRQPFSHGSFLLARNRGAKKVVSPRGLIMAAKLPYKGENGGYWLPGAKKGIIGETGVDQRSVVMDRCWPSVRTVIRPSRSVRRTAA